MSAEELSTKFIRNYSELLMTVWRDDDELRKLLADPTAYARQIGFDLEPGARVEVEHSALEAMPSKAEVAAKWSGTPGVHTLIVPEEPLINADELSEAELEAVAAGMNNNNIILIIL
jgi:hypothetical protein